jgi:hypothetical protein
MDGPREESINTGAQLGEIDRRLARLRSELASGTSASVARTPGVEGGAAGAQFSAPRGRASGPLAQVLAREHSSAHVVRAELHAGPFSDPEAVRAFARLLCELRAVVDVRLAGYEGADRAILEVTLAGEEAARRRGSPSA